MTILNEKTNDTKTREIKNISCVYTTQGKTDTELKDDYILIGSFSHNIILKSLKLTSSAALAGLTANIVLLDKDKKEFTYKDEGDDDQTLTALKTGIAFTTALTGTDQLPSALKFQTLEEYIINETAQPNYGGQVFIALKIATAPTAATAGVNILAETDFIEKI